MKIDAVRRFALALPEAAEAPHFVGLRVVLANADPAVVKALLLKAWRRKAGKVGKA